MFGRVMKHKITCLATCIALGAVCLYHGMSCMITLGKAYKQPYLLSGSDRFAFTGSYMMAAMHGGVCRSEEHTSELQSQPTISYAVFCLKKIFF